MTFKQRLPYFLGGLTIGIIIVAFIWDKKGTTFDYGPNSRVLKNLRTKDRIYSKKATATMYHNNLDTSLVSTIFKNGDVDLGNKIKLDSCLYQYNIQGIKEFQNVLLTVKNCDKTVIIDEIKID